MLNKFSSRKETIMGTHSLPSPSNLLTLNLSPYQCFSTVFPTLKKYKSSGCFLGLMTEEWMWTFEQILFDSPNLTAAINNPKLAFSFFHQVFSAMPAHLKLQQVLAIAALGEYLGKKDLLALRLTSKDFKCIADGIFELNPSHYTRNGKEARRIEAPSVLRVIKGTEDLQQLKTDISSLSDQTNPFPGRALVLRENDFNKDFLPVAINFLRYLGDHLWSLGIVQNAHGTTFDMDYYKVLATIPNVRRLEWIFDGCQTRKKSGNDKSLATYVTPKLDQLERLGVSWTRNDATNFVTDLVLHHSDQLEHLTVVSCTKGVLLLKSFEEKDEDLEFEFTLLNSLRLRFVDPYFAITIFNYWEMPQLTRLYLDLALDPREQVWSGHTILKEMSRCVGSTLKVLKLNFGKYNFKNVRRKWIRFEPSCLALPKLEKLALNGELILKTDIVAKLDSLQELIIQKDAVVSMTREEFVAQVWPLQPSLKNIIWVDTWNFSCKKQRFNRPQESGTFHKIWGCAVINSVGMSVLKVVGGFTLFCLFVKCCANVS